MHVKVIILITIKNFIYASLFIYLHVLFYFSFLDELNWIKKYKNDIDIFNKLLKISRMQQNNYNFNKVKWKYKNKNWFNSM